MPPTASSVTVEEPEMAANKAQDSTVATARPARNRRSGGLDQAHQALGHGAARHDLAGQEKQGDGKQDVLVQRVPGVQHDKPQGFAAIHPIDVERGHAKHGHEVLAQQDEGRYQDNQEQCFSHRRRASTGKMGTDLKSVPVKLVTPVRNGNKPWVCIVWTEPGYQVLNGSRGDNAGQQA